MSAARLRASGRSDSRSVNTAPARLKAQIAVAAHPGPDSPKKRAPKVAATGGGHIATESAAGPLYVEQHTVRRVKHYNISETELTHLSSQETYLTAACSVASFTLSVIIAVAIDAAKEPEAVTRPQIVEVSLALSGFVFVAAVVVAIRAWWTRKEMLQQIKAQTE